jgi:hypothetical protein
MNFILLNPKLLVLFNLQYIFDWGCGLGTLVALFLSLLLVSCITCFFWFRIYIYIMYPDFQLKQLGFSLPDLPLIPPFHGTHEQHASSLHVSFFRGSAMFRLKLLIQTVRHSFAQFGPIGSTTHRRYGLWTLSQKAARNLLMPISSPALHADWAPQPFSSWRMNGILAVFLTFVAIGSAFGQTITSFTPLSAVVGATVTITGTGFDATPANNTVFFGATAATVTAATTTELTVTVPVGAIYAPLVVQVANLTAESDAFFLPTFLAAASTITTASFAAPVDFATGTGPKMVAIADFDGDGKPDIAGTNYSDNTVSVYHNTATIGTIDASSFAAGVDFVTSANPEEVAVGDIDGDGKLDMVLVNVNSGALQVYRNTSTTGNVSFATKVEFTPGTTPFSVAVGDLDGDGKPDVVVTNSTSATLSIFRNVSTSGVINGSSLSAKVDFATGTQPYGLALGDLDGDGKPDLAVPNLPGNNISVFHNTTTSGIDGSSFAANVDFTAGNSPRSLEFGDLDGDGKLEIAVGNYGGTLSIYQNTSTSGTITTGSFAAKVDFTTGNSPRGIAIGDLDGDGLPEFAIANYNAPSVSVFRNTSTSGTINSGSLAAKVDFTTGTSPNDLAIGDLDGDGKPELVLPNNGSNTLSVFQNLTLGPPTLTSITPTVGNVGASVTITGTNFDPTHTNNSVFFGGVKATTTAGDATSVTATVPSGATFGSIIVQTSNLSVSSPEFFLPSFTGLDQTITAGLLAEKVDFATSTNPIHLVVGDFDGDGKPDVATAANVSGVVSVLRNTSSTGGINAASFAAKVDIATVANPIGLAVGDVDGDGKLDLVTVDFSSYVSVLRNTSTSGTISFATKVDFTTGSQPRRVAIGDLDQDGKLDLAVANEISNDVSFLRNTSTPGTISFATKSDYALGASPIGLDIGDIDGDGKPEVLVATTVISVLRNTGTPGTISFATQVDFTAGSLPLIPRLGDVDGDGKLDMSVPNKSSNTISVFRNTSSVGSITFAAKVDYGTGAVPTDVFIGDLDGDGKADLATVNETPSTISVFKNGSTVGTLSLSTKVDFSTGSTPRYLSIADIDGDGRAEIIVSSNANTISVHRNIADPPTISSLSVTTGAPGASVTIAGTNFDATHTNNTVFIGGVKATTTAGNATSITATIPNGATYGPVSVQVNGRTAESEEFFLPRYTGVSQTVTAGLLATNIDFTVGTNPRDVISSDVDGDGKPDLILVNYNSNTVSVLRNASAIGGINGTSFEAKVDLTTGAFPRFGALGDLDGDGKLDLAVSNYNDNTVSVFRNTGSSGTVSFAAKVDFATSGSNVEGVAIADLDGDGKLDVAVVNNTTNTVSVFKNTAVSGVIDANSFATNVDFTLAASSNSLDIADLDGDGQPDLVVGYDGTAVVSVLRNTATPGVIDSGSFAAKVDLTTTGTSPFGVAIGDLDGDGKLDLAVANRLSDNVSVFRNISSAGTITTGSFAAKVDFTTATQPRSVKFGDLDGDGKPEMVVAAQTSNVVSVFQNTSTSGSITGGSFAAKIDFATGTVPFHVEIADFDGDRRPDIATANNTATSVSVLHNIADPPTITSLSATKGPPGSSLTITGTNFYSSHTNNTVFIGGIKATTTAGNATSITATVPDGATFGPVTVVTLGGRTAHSDEFFLPTYAGIPGVTTNTLASKVDFAGGTGPRWVAVGDLDGDGKPDLAIANNGSDTVSVYRNTGTSGIIDGSSFATKVDFATGPDPTGVAIGDLDGDGKNDLAVTSYTPNTVSIFRNISTSGTIDGSSFLAKVDFTTGGGPITVAIGDLDGDGKADIAVGNSTAATMSVYKNTSTSGVLNANSFTAKVDFTTGTTPSVVAIGDIDGDGKPDLTVSNYSSANVSVFRNTSTSGTIDSNSFAAKTDFTSGVGPYVTLAELDGDGKIDLAVVNHIGNTVSLYRSTSTSGTIDGSTFAAKVDFATGTNPYNLAIGDLDGDGKPDLVVPNSGSDNLSVYRNTSTSGTIDGSSFTAKVDFAAGTDTYWAAIADFDGDGKPDLAASNNTSNNLSIFHNQNGFLATFTDIATTATVDDAGSGSGAAFGDYNGDGDLDLFLVNSGSADRLYRNDGSNIFADQGGTTADAGAGRGAAFGDFDNDGDLDLYVARGSGSANFLYENTDGNGAWTDVAGTKGVASTLDSYTPSWIDYDSDGDLDLFVAVAGAANLLYQNSGAGSFTFTDVAATAGVDDASNAEGAAWADYDGDGLVDLYVGNNASVNLLYRNEGDGTFYNDASTAGVQAAANATISPGWADYDGDGDLDLFVGNNSATTDQLFNNDGDGTFTDVTGASGVTNTTSVVGSAWADFDNDGDLDLFANGNGVADLTWINNGDGTFTDLASTLGFTDTGNGRAIAWADIDGNGTQDLYVVNSGSANLLYLNNGTANHYLQVELDGLDSNEFGYGAEVTVSESGVFRQTHRIDTGSGWNSQGAEIVHFGLGTVTTVDSLIVKWPTGRIQVVLGVAADQLTTVTEPGGLVTFSEVASASGVASATADGFSSWADYDADGDLDLYVGSDAANTLYRNDGAGAFSDANIVLLEDTGYARSTVWADYDNDGDLDLFVGNVGSASKFFRNDGGGSFVDESTNAGLTALARGAAWGDFNNDGFIDLYATGDDATVNLLYDNNHDGTFSVVGGNEGDGTTTTYGVAFGDYDDDGDLDLYIGNHSAASKLYRNDDGVYNSAAIGALEVSSVSPGVSWADYDNDGDLDLAVGSATDRLFRNDGSGTFVDQADFLGLNKPAQNYTPAWADYDNDGDLDLLLSADSNGNNRLYLNIGNGSFEGNIAPGVGLDDARTESAFGASWADYDDDGDLDLFVPQLGGANKLYRNDNTNGNKYLSVKLSETVSAPDGIGSTVEAWVGAAVQRRDVDGGSGYSAQGSLPVEFGFGTTTTLDSLIVRWSSGNITKQTTVATDQTLTVNEPSDVFINVASSAGVNSTGLEVGMTWGDFNGDGNPDIYLLDTAGANKLYRNNGDNTFTDMSGTSGVDEPNPTRTGVWGDYNGDGLLDLYVGADDTYPTRLYRNNGDETFTDQASATSTLNSTGDKGAASWADFDKDGDMDLYVSVDGSNPLLYRNNGDNTFTDIASPAGVSASASMNGLVWFDFDNDGDQDIYTAHPGQLNRLYRNNGNNTFTDIAGTAGVDDATTSHWGIAVGDYDRDGDQDVYLTISSNVNRLYRNNGDNTFTDIASSAGVDDTQGDRAASWVDYDNNGMLDLHVVSANSIDKLYLSNNDATFTDVASEEGLTDNGNGQAADWADFDGDGDLDLYISKNSATVGNALYRNDNAVTNYLQVKLSGTRNKFGIGASVYAVTGTDRRRQDVDGGSGYRGSQPSTPVEFGFGGISTVDSLIVLWPSGKTFDTTNVATNQVLTIEENLALFTEVASTVGVADTGSEEGVAMGDFDGDGDLDIYVAGNTTANRLYQNNGSGSFTNIATAAGVDDVTDTRGAAWGDYDGDGDLDMYGTVVSGNNSLYRNNGNGTFTDQGGPTGTNDASNGLTASWVDYDNDGDLDIAVGTSQVANRLYRNDGGTFTDVGGIGGGAGVIHYGMGWGDYDDDGDLA